MSNHTEEPLFAYILCHVHRHGEDVQLILSDIDDLDALDLMVINSDNYELGREDETVIIQSLPSSTQHVIINSADACQELLMVPSASLETRTQIWDNLDSFDRENLMRNGLRHIP